MKIAEYKVKVTSYEIDLEPQDIAEWFYNSSVNDIKKAVDLIGRDHSKTDEICKHLDREVCQYSKDFWKDIVSSMRCIEPADESYEQSRVAAIDECIAILNHHHIHGLLNDEMEQLKEKK